MNKIANMPRDLLVLIIIYGVFSVLPAFLQGNLAIMNILIMILIWSVVAGHWDLMMGYAGVFTFGNVALFVIGAFTSGILSSNLGVPPGAGILIGGVLTAGIGVLIGLPCLRLKGAYVALITFALHMILDPLFKSDLGRAMGTGGAQGLLSIPPLSVGGYTFSSLELVPWFYVALGISFGSLFAIYKIIHSSWGRAFVAVRDSEAAAKSVGVDDYRYKLIVFGVAAFFTGLIGAFYSHYVGILSTRILGLDLFLLLMVMQVIGGMGRFPGALIGAIIATFANEALRAAGIYRLVAFGAIVMGVVVFAPDGIMGAIFSARSRRLKRSTYEKSSA
jgi:branched-chain amino acid transport system permease protein